VLNVQLAPAEKQLEQAVVVGYGKQRKRDLTGAVSVVTAADIANRPIVDVAEALQGRRLAFRYPIPESRAQG
jgi:outer membrane receptor for ferrienterochelin and colicin